MRAKGISVLLALRKSDSIATHKRHRKEQASAAQHQVSGSDGNRRKTSRGAKYAK